MLQKTNDENMTKAYVSCIKVAGINLLPPLITEDRRKQLLEYKRQAVCIEKTLKRERELREYIQQFYTIDSKRRTNTPQKSPQSAIKDINDSSIKETSVTTPNKTPDQQNLEDTKTVYNEYKNHLLTDITTLNQSQVLTPNVNEEKETSSNQNQENDLLKLYTSSTFPMHSNHSVLSSNSSLSPNVSVSEVPLQEENYQSYITSLEHQVAFGECSTPKPKTLSLTCNIESFEYNSENQKSNSPDGNKSSDFDSLNTGTVVENLSKSPPKSGSDRKSPKPKLIRSNSYTLETPSPILLAHLQNHLKKGSDSTTRIPSASKEKSPMRTASSLDGDKFAEDCSPKTPKSQGRDFKDYANQISSLCLANLIKESPSKLDESPKKSKTAKNSSTAKNVFSDDTLPFSVDENKISQRNDNENIGKLEQVFENNLPDQDSDIESQLSQVLEKLPGDYSKKILELLDKQRSQLEHQYKTYLQKKDVNSDELQKSYSEAADYCHPLDLSPTHTDNARNDSVNYQISSQSLYYTMSSSNDTLNAIQSPMTDSGVSEKKFGFKDGSGDNCDIGALNLSIKSQKRDSLKSEDFHRKNKAASVIGAAVKGYLTRRLLKTDRVQSLISTIKEALVCAMSLHSENHENILPADVELHRRLIQQVSAACFEFHEVFFDLDIEEKMQIIAQDRQRQLDKLKRPTSSSSIRSSSSQSSARSKSTSRQPKTPNSSRKLRT